MQTSRLFKTSQAIVAKEMLLTNKGEVYLEAGGEARIMVYDPVKYPESPYGLRKADEHNTTQYFKESQLANHPTIAAPVDVWDANPAEYYRHPANPHHEKYRHCNWMVDPATL